MKSEHALPWRMARALGGICCVLAAMSHARAAVVDLARSPLYTTTTSSVKPNLLFILDNSGSMGWDYLPDEASGSSTFGYLSSQCNGVGYNPNIAYTLPVDASGNPYPTPSFSAACSNGFSGSCSVNLSGKYYYNYVGSQPALSYTYDTNGVIATQFYNECKAAATASPTAVLTVSGSASTSVTGITVNGVQIMSGSSAASTSSSTVASNIAGKITMAGYSATASGNSVTITGPNGAAAAMPVVASSGGMTITPSAFTPFVKVAVSSTSGPGGTDERQNYANWYSFYRIRIMMMKTAVSQAFKNITSNFRVGYTTISDTGATDGTNFLHIDDFTSAQKTSFYSKLSAASGNSTTPLRGALSKAGRIFAGKLGADPMQYSCQQNFALLSTDGYWNTGSESSSYGPFGLDNQTPVGQQDGGAPAPMGDGGVKTVTDTTPITTITTTTTPSTQVDRSTRQVVTTTTATQRRNETYQYTKVTVAKSNCTGGKVKPTTTVYTGSTVDTQTTSTPVTQTQEQITTSGFNTISTTTSTVTHTVVTTNGIVTSDTYSNPSVSTTNSQTTTSGPSTSPWSNVGSPVAGTATVTNSYSPPLSAGGGIAWTVSSGPTVGTCANVSASDTFTLTSSGSWTTTANNSTSSTGATAHDPAYPQTTPNGAGTTVVQGPTTGATVETTTVSGGNYNSLADVAMYYYQTDLRYPGTCTSGATNSNLCPVDSNGNYAPNVPGNGNDNNPKPHMTTFTLGLGVNGLLKYSSTYETDTSGDFFGIRNGTKGWPDPQSGQTSPYGNTSTSVIERVDDLWHAAVNGRGKYFSAKNPTALVSSLNAALAGMSARLGYGTSAATSNLSPIQGDNALYVASYTTARWIGNLVAESIDPDTGAVNPTPSWCVSDVAADAANGIPGCTGTLGGQVGSNSDARTIYINKGGSFSPFLYSNLPAAQQAYFAATRLSQYSSTYTAAQQAAATGETLVNYLRGQRQYENGANETDSLYRYRSARLGDIVDTAPGFLGKPVFNYSDPGYAAWKTSVQNRAKTVFVGANDGMLHAFDAATGLERWAFIPTPVMSNLYWLADNTYAVNHHNYVDGKLSISDICAANCSSAASAEWHTILVGGLGQGGRGYFAIDVTDPTSPKLLWELTSLQESDLGYTYGNPLAAKKKDGTWVILLSSGYDNVLMNNGDPYDANGTGKGVLYVLDPITGQVLDRIKTTAGDTATPSGLSRIAAWADNPETDATTLYVYGGDLLGNLWRFDINPPSSGAAVLLTTFKDAAGNAQPITTRPELGSVSGQRVVYVATGKYLEAKDLDSTQFKMQTIYGFVDAGITVTNPRGVMQKQTLADAKPNRTVTANSVQFLPPNQMGWYVDLPDSGERANVDMTLLQGTLLVPTNVPTNGICEAGGYSWLNYLNYENGSYVANASNAGVWTGNDLTTGINLVWIKGQPIVIRTGSGSAPKLVTGVPFGTGQSNVVGHRVSWREIFETK